MAQQEPIFQGDDTGSFGGKLITINLYNPLNYQISKAIFVCECITKTYLNPTFPIEINFSSEETKQMRAINQCFLVVYDQQGRQKTCPGTLTLKSQKGVLPNGCRR